MDGKKMESIQKRSCFFNYRNKEIWRAENIKKDPASSFTLKIFLVFKIQIMPSFHQVQVR